MAAVVRAGATHAFGWVGSDGWSARALVSDGNEAAVEGTISVQPQANPVLGFQEYFLNLTVENNPRNPWFVGNRLFVSVAYSLGPSFQAAHTKQNQIISIILQSSGKTNLNAGIRAARARHTTCSTRGAARAASVSPLIT